MEIEMKPDAFGKRFLEWSYFHGCPLKIKEKDGEWKDFHGKRFDWKTNNYKIENPSHKEYYERLYAHGTN